MPEQSGFHGTFEEMIHYYMERGYTPVAAFFHKIIAIGEEGMDVETVMAAPDVVDQDILAATLIDSAKSMLADIRTEPN